MKSPRFLALALFVSTAGLCFSQISVVEQPWGASAYGNVANRSFGAGSSVSSSPFNFAPDSGGAGFLQDDALLVETRGAIQSSVILTNGGGISVPQIRSRAATGDGEFSATGAATGVEAYLYQGAGPKSFTLNVTLSGSVSNMDNDFAGNFANISVWSTGASSFLVNDPGNGAALEIETPFFFSTSTGDYLEFGFAELDSLALEQNGLGGDDLLNGSVSWTMNPGDVVFLHAQGFSRVYGPNSVADASNTLTMGFQDAGGLTAGSGGLVPEPGAALLGSIGLGLIVLRRRR